MKAISLLLAAVLAAPLPALAACMDDIATMFDGGPLDPFARPAHRFTATTTGPDGVVKSVYRAEFVSPAHSMGWTEGNPMQVLIIGSDSWIRMAEDTPWMAAPNMVPADHEGFLRLQRDQQRANLTEVDCLGTLNIDGVDHEAVSFVTRTDPAEGTGAWFGGHNRVFIAMDTGRVMRWEVTEAVSSFAPEPSADTQVILYDYDEQITLPRPEN